MGTPGSDPHLPRPSLPRAERITTPAPPPLPPPIGPFPRDDNREVSSAGPVARAKPAGASDREFRLRWLWSGMAAFFLTLWAATLGSPPGFAVAFNYLGLCGALVATVALASRVLGRAWVWWPGLGIAIVLLGVFASLDTYEELTFFIRSHDTGQWMIGFREVDLPTAQAKANWREVRWRAERKERRDSIRRWTGRRVWSWVSLYGPDGKRLADANGPLCPSGAAHGQWHWTFWEPQFDTREEWSWYGEKVSEGEWHRYNAGR